MPPAPRPGLVPGLGSVALQGVFPCGVTLEPLRVVTRVLLLPGSIEGVYCKSWLLSRIWAMLLVLYCYTAHWLLCATKS
jgi:hypothetical protein